MQDAFGGEPSVGDLCRPLATETYEILPGHLGLPAGRAAGARTTALTPGLVLLCDHAGNAFPPGYGTLGLPASELERHIAYDIGAAGVVRAMCARLGAPAVLSRYSRLLIDLNRGADDPTLIMRLSDGAIVPGNHPIDPAEWDRRIRLYYRPYHAAIERVLMATRAAGQTPVIVSLHSYTPAWKSVPRPWHVGMLWDRDKRLSQRLIDRLSEDASLVVGDNKPYSGQLEGDCLYQHATRHGLSHSLIEVRQDLIASAEGQEEWARRLSDALEAIWAEAQALDVLSQLPSNVVDLAARRAGVALPPAGPASHMSSDRVAAAPA